MMTALSINDTQEYIKIFLTVLFLDWL